MELILFSEVLTSKDKQEFDINQDEHLLDFYPFAFFFLHAEGGKELQ